MMEKDRIWLRGDLLSALVAGGLAFAVYVWTAAPNVTLLDSGEFIVAAQHFGVPHPTGYPLWTLLAWLFQLLPLGNAAWEINIFSGVCGGLAVGLMTLLCRSSLRWLFEERLDAAPGLNSIVSISAGLLFGFSFSMWSQATISEVYTLHALLIGGFFLSLYVWLRRPDHLGLLLLPFFLLALAFSNHHLSVALGPLPFVAVLLVRRKLFWDLVMAVFLTTLLAYLGFAILSGDQLILKTAIRFFYCVMAGLLVLVLVRRANLEWRLIAYLPFVVALGLLPYAYMPLASSTNPPMNWAYTRTPEGFFFSFNRSQYSGSLTQQSLRSLGRLVGTAPKTTAEAGPPEDPNRPSMLKAVQDWTGFFWLQLARSFTPLGIIAYFVALLIIFRLGDVTRRTWVYLLEFGFVLAAILQPAADRASIDVAGWWLQMPYHTYTNLIFGLLVALGLVVGMLWLIGRFPRIAPLRYALLLLPLMPLWLNYDGCSQRGRWFGWQFGHDMLKDLPKSSVVFGGTDPGRFVPTYMILGESPQPPSVKRDPTFDRRDLYIITQNGVGEPLYRRYLEDHYSANRPKVANAFERWLGRETIYPEKPLVFPTEQEIDAAIRKEMEAQNSGPLPEPFLPHSVVTRLIWEKNKDHHDFFVEESYPMTWSYDYALPNGLSYRIMKEPLKEIPADVVKKDMEFWTDYATRLLENPDFTKDLDAQRSFSKLRITGARLYEHRKMEHEAEIAYRQALALWPGNPEALQAMSKMLWDRKAFDQVIEMVTLANAGDPNNDSLWRLRALAERRKEIEGEIQTLEKKVAESPEDQKATEDLLELYSSVGETNLTASLLTNAVQRFRTNKEFLNLAVNYSAVSSLPDLELTSAQELVKLDPEEADYHLLVARAAARKKNRDLFFHSAKEALRLGGIPIRETLERSPDFQEWREGPEFQKLIGKEAPKPAPTP